MWSMCQGCGCSPPADTRSERTRVLGSDREDALARTRRRRPSVTLPQAPHVAPYAAELAGPPVEPDSRPVTWDESGAKLTTRKLN